MMDEKNNKNKGWLIGGIIGIVVLCLLCIGTILFLGVQGTVFRFEYKSSISAPEVPTPAPQRGSVCEYTAETTDDGLEVASGTKVKGPAIVQINPKEIVVVYPGEDYTLRQDAVVWLYKGDTECLLAQLEFFPGKEVQYIK